MKIHIKYFNLYTPNYYDNDNFVHYPGEVNFYLNSTYKLSTFFRFRNRYADNDKGVSKKTSYLICA